jgi:DNA-binding LacI/PurR family transcriptional regulator
MVKRKTVSKSGNRGVTIADVARVAGVSVPTVSRILNNKEYVADDTRDRVNKVIQELGYAPHAQARRLRGGESRTLAIHYPAESPRQQSSVIEVPYITGAAAAAGEKEYFLNFLLSQLTPVTLLNMFRSNQIDGIILLQVCLDDWRVNLLRENDYPFVMIGRCEDLDNLSFIDLDFEEAMLSAIDHLVALGHREIGLLAYPHSWRETELGPAIRTLTAYEHALEKHDLRACYQEVELNGVDYGFDGTIDLLQENPDLTAIVTVSQSAAAGSIKALMSKGYRVPEDFSVMAVAFGGEFANGVTPALTMLEWSPFEISYQATVMMSDKLANPDLQAQQILVPPKLIIRQSTKEVT